MQDYKSLCAAVMICATLVNIQTHTQTVFDQYIWKAQPAELKTTDHKLMSTTEVIKFFEISLCVVTDGVVRLNLRFVAKNWRNVKCLFCPRWNCLIEE